MNEQRREGEETTSYILYRDLLPDVMCWKETEMRAGKVRACPVCGTAHSAVTLHPLLIEPAAT